MADVWVVLLVQGSGNIANVYSTPAAALAYVTAVRPPCNYSIIQKTIDDPAGTMNIGQGYLTPPTGTVKQGHRNQ
jgi:hypothetical protein